MKKLFLVLSLVFCITGYSQIRISGAPGYRSMKNVPKSVLSKFKNQTTYFVVNEDWGIDMKTFDSIVKNSWSITKYELINEKDFPSHIKEGNTYMKPLSFSYMTGSGTKFTYQLLELFIVDKIKKNKKKKKEDDELLWESDMIATIFFSIDISGRRQVMREQIYTELLNYKKGYLKNAFQFLDKNLRTKSNYNHIKDLKNKDQLKRLKKKPLYISRNCIYGYNPFKTAGKETYTDKELLEAYRYELKIVEDEELNEMIFTDQEKESFYYLLYVQVNGFKYITVVNGKNGDIVYQTVKNFSYNLKPKDFEKLSKAIKSSK